MTAGTLYGVGVGPGDPELVTVKAARLIGAAGVVAFHEARPGRSIARATVEPYLMPGVILEPLVYPVTTERAADYDAQLEGFYADAAARLAAHLRAGRDVALLAEGDPGIYSSYQHLHRRLSGEFRCVIVPAVTAATAAAAAAGVALVEGPEALAILSATMPAAELVERLAGCDAAVVLKASRDLEGVRAALAAAGRLDEALVVVRASREDEAVSRLTEVDVVPYMAVVVVPGRHATRPPVEPGGEVVVIGLGPGGPQWLTPEARVELAAATDLVGYQTYTDRVTVLPGQTVHASDNRVEAERAEMALSLARRGRRVAVVSSGDPGVFAMASAVLEVREALDYQDVPVRVVPGVSAAQAVAARVGAPLGHDYAVISLSDQRKPWAVVAGRVAAAAEADLVLAFYNPASASRREHLVDLADLLAQHRKPETPVVVGRAVGSADETVVVTTLDRLDWAAVDMRTLLIVGSTQTVATPDGAYTPRTYPGESVG
jgi:precorrin-2 C20-methyltransferase/precorrin-3B C17-methyltransferase